MYHLIFLIDSITTPVVHFRLKGLRYARFAGGYIFASVRKLLIDGNVCMIKQGCSCEYFGIVLPAHREI